MLCCSLRHRPKCHCHSLHLHMYMHDVCIPYSRQTYVHAYQHLGLLFALLRCGLSRRQPPQSTLLHVQICTVNKRMQATFLRGTSALSSKKVENPSLAAELEELDGDRLDTRCRRNGLSKKGGRDMQVRTCHLPIVCCQQGHICLLCHQWCHQASGLCVIRHRGGSSAVPHVCVVQ